jgi:bifunctional non-homologous end joining protein LigD
MMSPEVLKSRKRNMEDRPLQDKTEPYPNPLPCPMLAKLTKELMDNPEWIYEMKLDGYRMIAAVRNGKANMVSRNGKSFNEKYEILLRDLNQVEDDVILDGEMVIEKPNGLTDFQLLQNYGTTKKGNLKYFVFDILYLNGHNLMGFPLLKRKELLESFFEKYSFSRIIRMNYQTGDGKKLFNDLSAHGFEGIIAKDPESVYRAGRRSDSWLKIKSQRMQEAVICGFTEPQGGRKYFGSIILGLYDKDELKYVGNCGTGFNDESLKELYTKFELLKTDASPFMSIPKFSWAKGKPTWIKPELVANIKFLEWSDEGIMRSPVFMGLREDKDPRRVINESLVADKNALYIKGRDVEKERIVKVSGKTLNITNLTKIYWPGEGYTKGDLIDYYSQISKYILPYLKDRPQSLNRHPNGIMGKSFYQKDMDVEEIPSWLKTVQIYSKTNNAEIDYLICNNEATLLYMANLGCIEINPWHSTYKKSDNPTYVMLDLDPGNISFTDVVNTALVIKEICDQLEIPGYCKTSGATGLHIYIPLAGKYDYEQAKTFAEILAGITHSRLPSTTSIERMVSKRRDKVYIDFLQNRKGQTIAAPYSVRPRPHATVSAPLDWSEVNHQLSPEMFTIKNMRKRIEQKGDLWQPVLGKGIHIENALRAISKLE